MFWAKGLRQILTRRSSIGKKRRVSSRRGVDMEKKIRDTCWLNIDNCCGLWGQRSTGNGHLSRRRGRDCTGTRPRVQLPLNQQWIKAELVIRFIWSNQMIPHQDNRFRWFLHHWHITKDYGIAGQVSWHGLAGWLLPRWWSGVMFSPADTMITAPVDHKQTLWLAFLAFLLLTFLFSTSISPSFLLSFPSLFLT